MTEVRRRRRRRDVNGQIDLFHRLRRGGARRSSVRHCCGTGHATQGHVGGGRGSAAGPGNVGGEGGGTETKGKMPFTDNKYCIPALHTTQDILYGDHMWVARSFELKLCRWRGTVGGGETWRM